MESSKKTEPTGLTRRDALKFSGVGLALGGLAIGGAMTGSGAGKAQAQDDNCSCPEGPTCDWSNYPNTNNQQQYSYFESLDLFNPYDPNTKTTIAPLGKDEMRITFMGSCIPAPRRAQQMMSVFVEVGWDSKRERPLDQFVFDCGSGVCANYGAMNAGYGRMDKVFMAHLHGDHMSDLTHIYGFGPAGARKSPLYVWGPPPSQVGKSQGFGKVLRRWHQGLLCTPPGSLPVALGELQLPGDKLSRLQTAYPEELGTAGRSHPRTGRCCQRRLCHSPH